MNALLITIISLVSILLLSLVSPVKQWIHSLKQNKSIGIVIITLFVSLYITGGETSGLTTESIDLSRIFKIIILLTLLAITTFSLLTSHSNSIFGGGALPYLLYILFAFGSFYYSSNPLLTIWKSIEVLSVFTCFIWIKTRFKDIQDITDTINIIWLVFLYLSISSITGGLIEPSSAYIRQIYGSGTFAFEYWSVFPRINPNSLSQIGALTAISAFIYFLTDKSSKNRSPSIFIFIIGFGVLLIAHSRTSLLAAIFCIMITLFYSNKKTIATIMFVLTSIITVTFGAQQIIKDYILRGQSAEVFTSLSGRTEFWPIVWKSFLSSPIFGHGYYAGHRDFQLENFSIIASSVDNTYLEVLVDLGITGSFFFILSIIILLTSIYKSRPSKLNKDIATHWNKNWLSLLSISIIILIRSITGPSFQNMHMNLILYMLVIICISFFLYSIKTKSTLNKDITNVTNKPIPNNSKSVRLRT